MKSKFVGRMYVNGKQRSTLVDSYKIFICQLKKEDQVDLIEERTKQVIEIEINKSGLYQFFFSKEGKMCLMPLG